MPRWLKLLPACVLGCGLIAELALRSLGLRDHPLFVADTRYEYLMAPDQDVRYGGIRYITNALGLRNGPIGPKNRRRVLVLGDSVINGGQQTTQDSLATVIAQQASGVELVNVSAASWGPDNAMAFLRVHGTFQADGVIAVFSSHDAYDRMTFEPIVGLHPSYPDHRPMLALSAQLDRLLFRAGLGYRPTRQRSGFVQGWRALRDTCLAMGIPFTVLLHPELDELAHRTYDERGSRVLDSLRAWHVPTVNMLDHLDSTVYTDRIHVNDSGQRALAHVLVSTIDTTRWNTFGRASTTER
jgi:hypothetical protein